MRGLEPHDLLHGKSRQTFALVRSRSLNPREYALRPNVANDANARQRTANAAIAAKALQVFCREGALGSGALPVLACPLPPCGSSGSTERGAADELRRRREHERGEAVLRVPKVTKDEFEELDGDAAVELLTIRYRALADAGFQREEAALVAVHPEVDVEGVVALVRRGCPVRTALRILL